MIFKIKIENIKKCSILKSQAIEQLVAYIASGLFPFSSVPSFRLLLKLLDVSLNFLDGSLHPLDYVEGKAITAL